MEKNLASASPWVMVEEDRDQHLKKLQISVSFRDLSCHGFVTASQHQRTFFDYALFIPRFIAAGFRQPPKKKVSILSGFEGMILPGQMLLVLGRPGSGCSTFLKTLSGDSHGFRIADEANINYRGISYRRFHNVFKGERVYVAELDVHFPELTLGQTLNFATSTRENSSVTINPKDVASLFGLGEAFDTPIGDALIRGVSGGEKRRTSIAEAFIGGAQFQCWDNSTRGLDALTARQFIQLLRKLTNTQKSTVAMSLYQASEAMYQSFDNVILLYEGRQIYFGSSQSAVDYFTRLGYVRPARTTTADFLTSLTNPAERIVRSGYENQVPRSPEEFSSVWRQSPEAKLLRTQIETFNAAHPITSGPEDRIPDSESLMGSRDDSTKRRLQTCTYPLSIPMQVLVCLDRSFQRLRTNIASEISAIVANTILGVIIGSVFYNLSETTDSLDQRTLLLFFALMVNAFIPGIEVILMWAQRPIVEKQHRYAFYHPFTERLASIVSALPAKIAICFCIHLPIYFMANLRRSVSAFFVYWLFMFANLVTMSMLFRMIGSISRTREQTTIPVSVGVLLFIIYTGFVIPPDYMKPWLGWVWRINPLAYTYESLVVNEMRNHSFPCSTLLPAGPSYTAISPDQKVCAAVGSTIGQQSVQGTTYIELRYDYFESHLWRNLAILIAMIVAFCVIHLLASEYVSAQPSKGEVLVFRQPRDKIKKGSESLGARSTTSDPVTGPPKTDRPMAVISRQAGEFHWTSLNFEVKERKILQDIHGWVKPGTLTALMGVTGAGKTSLLDALANRSTSGKVSGQVLVDGFFRDASFQRKVGYVQQEDVHLATTTVREALEFSALLRQPSSTPKSEKIAYVDDVLDMMDMQWYSNAVIGVPGQGLNVEQRKRLTIAVEMVAKPELLLFLDEPTSGLDSQTAWSICTLLRKLADNGQTILCTIHQPSSQLFLMFDRLLLLGKGGRTLYFGDIGDNASTMVQYFESNGAQNCHPEANPAEWMLEVTGNISEFKSESETKESKSELQQIEWSEKWNQSTQKQQVLHQLAEMDSDTTRRTSQTNLHNYDGQYAASFVQQMMVVSKSILQDQWRDPVYLYSKIGLSALLALVNGISFYNSPLDVQGITNLLFSIFLITQLFSCVDQLVIPHFSNMRSMFEARDRHSNAYSWVVFIGANVIVELIWQTIIAVPIFAAWYYPTGLHHRGDFDPTFGVTERGALVFVLIWLFNLWASTVSQLFAAAIENTEMAMQMATLFYWLALVFCGILSPPDKLARFWIFMYRVSPLTYFLEGLAVAGLANAKVTCSSIETIRIPLPNGSNSSSCGQYLRPFVISVGGEILNPLENSADCQFCPYSDVNTLLNSFGMQTDHRWRNAGFMAIYVVFNISMTFGVYWLVRVEKKRA
ncbi:ABC drug exporter AbcA [Bombardia bombarda]|uniref:ABC drug exporter AbcA n=1 Tax=Bombardia bombarda TaxID=252184 RepID=A0AA39XBS4_9PEZI|nr:ABC drug exporter AbcA [Bombardia bombarda]